MSGDPMADPNEGIEPFEATEHYATPPLTALERQAQREEAERLATEPKWFAIIDGKDERQTVGRVLVVAGRIASHSWGLSYIGREWHDERARVEGRNGWTVEELPNV